MQDVWQQERDKEKCERFSTRIPLSFEIDHIDPSRGLQSAHHKLDKILASFIAAGFLAFVSLPVQAQSQQAPDPWPSLVSDVFHDRPMQDGAGVIALEAPVRAEDAALVPMKLSLLLAPDDPRRVTKITLVIDENPAPVAAVFEIGPTATIQSISTRVRVNQYTNVHAVAELSDGALYSVSRFVKAAGGCSAPATKNMDAANSTLGQMKFRTLADNETPSLKDAVFMMRHPNTSGLQMDQISHLYIPARYVNSLQISQGHDLILAVEGGISISEDPNLRFSFKPNASHEIHADAKDTSGATFHGEWQIEPTM
jgi:sulfur-oxidizing protein SoxY